MVIGSGGREHALVWKLAQSPKIGKIYAAPGSSAIGKLAQCIDIKAENVKELGQFAQRNKIGLTVVGPDGSVAAGVVDEFNRRNLKIFGPTKAASELEWSKVFSKEFMRRHHIPTGSFKVFSNPNDAITFCRTAEFPLVVKADGLAAGKGVILVDEFKQAREAIDEIMTHLRFGKAGRRIVIEEFLEGVEVSIMCFSDGDRIWTMPPSQDHKRIGEGDTGPNTGGMGAYCPTTFLSVEELAIIQERVLETAIAGMASEGRPYKGVLYAGLMMTQSGPKVLEFNCRFGDPEAQVVLPLLESDLLEVLSHIAKHQPPKSAKKSSQKSNRKKDEKKTVQDEEKQSEESNQTEQIGPIYLRDLVEKYDVAHADESSEEETVQPTTHSGPELKWRNGAAATVILASRGYPGKPTIGKKISGLSKGSSGADSVIFHAGTKHINDTWVTSGGRVLNVTGLGADVPSALKNAYREVEKIKFEGMQFRKDIGHQATEHKEKAIVD